VTGLYLRLRLDETPPFTAAAEAGGLVGHPVREALRASPGRVAIGFGLVAAASVTFNTFFVFLPGHLVGTLGVPLERALSGALLGLLVVVVASPVLGGLSDRVGRRPVLLTGTIGLALLTLPAYLLARDGGRAGQVLAYVAVGSP